jgi:hypothetical protein
MGLVTEYKPGLSFCLKTEHDMRTLASESHAVCKTASHKDE